jgi:hypothetical protein
MNIEITFNAILWQHYSSSIMFIPPDQPIVASFPHFYGRFGPWTEKLEGLHPNRSIHESYTVLEPLLGVPLDSKATSQSSLATKDLSSFDTEIAKFSNLILPMFWIEYVRA